MTLIKLLVVLISLHLGMGFTQISVSYFAGDVADYGAAGVISHTPIGSFIDLDDDARRGREAQGNPSSFESILGFVNNLGDMVNGMASFGYGALTQFSPDDGLVYTIIIILRIIGTMFTVSVALAVLRLVFDSGILNSTLGMGLFAIGSGTLGLSSLVGAIT